MSSFIKKQNQIVLSCKEAVNYFGDAVYKIALSNMKNIVDAQTVFQEVFIKYIHYTNGFNTLEDVKTWFVSVTIDSCQGMHKDKIRQETLSLKKEVPIHLKVETIAKMEEEKRERKLSFIIKVIIVLLSICIIIIATLFFTREDKDSIFVKNEILEERYINNQKEQEKKINIL